MRKVKQFESFLKEEMDQFRRWRKAGNRWSNSYEDKLYYFSRYLNENYPKAETLTQEMVDGWCSQRDTEKPRSYVTRIGAARQFLLFLNDRNLTTVKPFELPKVDKEIYKACYFSDEILDKFFQACDALAKRPKLTKTQKLRALMVPIFFRLLFSTGMRTTEARLLRRKDVDFITGVISIELTKGHIEHYTVMHDSMLKALRRYDLVMEELMPGRKYLFVNIKGEHLSKGWVSDNFMKIWKSIFEEEPPKARAYDFRHEFISRNIEEITDKGMEADDDFTALQKSVGHASAESTRRYFSIRPVLAGIIEERSNKEAEKLIGKGAYRSGKDFSQEAQAAEMRALEAKYKKSLQSAQNLLEEFEAELEDDEDLLGKGAY